MARRDAVPLYMTRHVAFVEAIQEADNPDKAIASQLAVGTGPRGDTICHTHSSWFVYSETGELYYRIPGSDPCYKYGDTSPCGDCRRHGHEGYEPKTPAGGGRRILLTNTWINPVTKEEEYFGLRDAVESYFAISDPRAPDGVQHGHEMIDGDGISLGTLNEWIRDIGALSTISKDLREDRLRDVITINENSKVDQIKDFGKDEDGNEIPDMFSHDLRATYCTHLMRNDVPPNKAINKTGHKEPESMNRYIHLAAGEIGPEEESGFY